MAVPSAYLTSSRGIKEILENVQKAGVPQRFTYEFLKQLGHASSADRPAVAVLKALRFLSDNGEPTERYRRFKDPGQARLVMAEALRDAYADVFTVDQQANERTSKELQGVFARLSGKGEAVNEKMATTFKALSELADFSGIPPVTQKEITVPPNGQKQTGREVEETLRKSPTPFVTHHDVHIHLPISTDIAVYDAIFRSIREHLT